MDISIVCIIFCLVQIVSICQTRSYFKFNYKTHFNIQTTHKWDYRYFWDPEAFRTVSCKKCKYQITPYDEYKYLNCNEYIMESVLN